MTRFHFLPLIVWLLSSAIGGALFAASPSSIDTVPNGGFEQMRDPPRTHTHPMPLNWWLNPRDDAVQPTDEHFGLTDQERLTGQRAAFVDAIDKGSIGWLSERFDVPADLPGYRLSARVKRSYNYQNNQPIIMIFWFKGDRWIGQMLGGQLDAKGPWETWGVEEPGDLIPEGTDGAKIYVGSTAVAGPAGQSAAGRLWWDDVRIDIFSPPDGLVNFRMKCQQDYSWFTLDQLVTFKTSQPGLVSAKVQTVRAVVYDSHERAVDHLSVDRQAFLDQGITWKPKQPGFYQFEFACVIEGRDKPLPLAYSLKTRLKTGAWLSKTGSRHNIVVTAAAPRPMAQRLPQIGLHLSGGDSDFDLRFIDMLEVSFIRYQSVQWYKMEPQRGKHDWSAMDRDVEMFKSRGLPIIATFWGTPQWASSHPEKTAIDIFIPGYVAYAPTDMNDFTDFVKRVIERYRNDIHTWEIWNEPHLPYGSIFWRDTPEKYVELLRAGYQTIQQQQPDAQVWIGGMGGQRYLPFYKIFLQLGGGVYYDRLALHGSWPTPASYRVLEKMYHAPSVPWVDSEWHAILINASDPTFPTEADLGKRMLTDLCNHFKHRVEKIAIFGTREWLEKEFIPDARRAGVFAQSCGLFRSAPYIQPRLPAILLRTFLDHFTGLIIYRGEYVLDGEQKAILMDSDAGPVLLLWTDAGQPQPLDTRLAAASSAGAKLMDWEDRPLASDKPVLEPGCMYYMTGLPPAALASLPTGGHVLPTPPMQRKDVPVAIENEYTPGRLLGAVDATPDPQDVHWIDKGLVYKSIDGRPQQAGYSVRFAVAFNDAGLDVIVDVHDAVFHAGAKTGSQLYGVDSVQIALSTDETVMLGSQVEFQIGMTDKGPVIWKQSAPGFAGDLPADWSMTNQAVKYGRVTIHNADGVTRYGIHINRSELYPWAYTVGAPQYFSLLVNNNDGHGRAGYTEWAGGIGDRKDPALFGRLIPRK